VFTIARNSCEQFLDSIVTDSEHAKFKRKDDVRCVVEALSKSGGGGISTLRRSGERVKGPEDIKTSWLEYFSSKHGAPRLLLLLGLTVLMVRIAWNVTKIRLMLRTVLYHGLVAVSLFAAIFFVKGVFSDYLMTDDGGQGVDTASFSTIVSNDLDSSSRTTKTLQSACAARMENQ